MEYYVYEGPADKLDLTPLLGAEKVVYPIDSPLAPAGLAGMPTEFSADELEEMRTNPGLVGHKFRQVPTDKVKEMQAAKKATDDRRRRLARARTKNQVETDRSLAEEAVVIPVESGADVIPLPKDTKETKTK